MPSNKKCFLKAIFEDNVGCGCSKSKASLDIHQPKPISKTSIQEHPISCIPCPSSTTISYNMESTSSSESKAFEYHAMHASKFGHNVAIVKDSTDPYEDFRESMLQMIGEKDIYSREDLEELLKCFLELNLPCHHGVILEAFEEIWNMVIADKPTVKNSGAHQDPMKHVTNSNCEL